MKLTRQVSNRDANVAGAIELPLKRLSADYSTKKRIQFLLFPAGISYSKKADKCRTLVYSSFSENYEQQKRGIPELGLDYASFSTLVARRGIEPYSHKSIYQ